MGAALAPDPSVYPFRLEPDWPVGFPTVTVAGNSINLTLFVSGAPKPKGRPRTRVITPRGGGKAYANIYTDEKTRNWETEIENQIRGQIRYMAHNQKLPPLPIQGRVLVSARFNLPRPKSLPKKVLFPTKNKTDGDNLEKSLFDALQNADIIKNDCLITDHSNSKRFAGPGHPMGIEIDLTGILV